MGGPGRAAPGKRLPGTLLPRARFPAQAPADLYVARGISPGTSRDDSLLHQARRPRGRGGGPDPSPRHSPATPRSRHPACAGRPAAGQARHGRSARGRPLGAHGGRVAATAPVVHAPAGLGNRGRVVPFAAHRQVGDEVDLPQAGRHHPHSGGHPVPGAGTARPLAPPAGAGASTRATSMGRGAGIVDQKLEVVIIAVTDVDRATEFYQRLGWRLDATPPGIVQFTPPGSWCSVQFGPNLSSATPGSGKGYLIVSDIEAARDALVAAGAEVGEIFHLGPDGPVSGPDPERRTYRSWLSFNDPDGNNWRLQEITARLPGRVDAGVTSFSSVSDLANAMRRAEAAHGEHEKRTGQADANWPDWYTSYMIAEQAGTELPT